MLKSINMSLLLKVLAIITLVLILAATSLGFRFYNEYRHRRDVVEIDTIYNNIYVNGVHLGGMSKEEAYEKLEEYILETYQNKKITIIYDEEVKYSFLELGLHADIQASVERAYAKGREGSIRERYDQILLLNEEPYKIELDITYDLEKIYNVLRYLEEEIYIKPINATMVRSNNRFTVIEGTYGREIKLLETSQEVYYLLNLNKEGSVNVVTKSIAPKFNGDSFRESQSRLGSFTTNFTAGDNGRNTNIRNSASKINSYIVYPEEVFSTNRAFGVMTQENGYRYATVIINGEFVDGIGGGVCQVSTTLYMALLYAELEIVQRQNHSRKVGYVPPAFDATLAGDIIDLRFRNNTNNPIFIESIVTSNSVTVNIYGKETRPSDRSITFESIFIENVPPSEEIIIRDPDLPEGTRVVQTAESPGTRYRLYKVIMQNGTVVGRERVNTSTYRPRTGVVRVGTGPVETQNTPTPPARPPVNSSQPTETGYETPSVPQEEITPVQEKPIVIEEPIAVEVIDAPPVIVDEF